MHYGCRFELEKQLWIEANERRRDKILGFYPGMYLCPRHLERLGGREAFLAGFLDQIKHCPNLQDFYRVTPEGGLWIQMYRNAMDLSLFNSGGIGPLYSWLFPYTYRALRKANLLL